MVKKYIHGAKNKIKKHWSLLKAFIVLSLSLFFIGSGIGFLWISTLKIPDLSVFEARQVAESTKIYDKTGEIVLYDIHQDAKRTIIPFEKISEYIKKTTVAIEDAEFYNHKGIKPESILRAVIANFTSGEFSQGGSTITQQVIKNSVLTKDKTITRKLKEWVLAIKLEKMLKKDQILSIYLNENPYGGSLYGVEEASKAFFGHGASEVSLAEAAYLAALPQAPTFYSPYGKNKDRLDERQRLVLALSRQQGLISEEEYQKALSETVNFLPKNTSSIKVPHFSFFVRDYLVEKYGEELVETGGLKVITTLDYSMQQKAEEVVKNFAKSLEENYSASNTSIVAIDPKNGDILVMVGSKDYFDESIDGSFNIATAKRQPGSAFKPFVYATLFEKGYTSETVLFDVKTEFSSECNPDSTPKDNSIKPESDEAKKVCYSPVNYDDSYLGPMTIREALAQSRNVPAVKALYLAGLNNSIEVAEKMGITTLDDPKRFGLTLVLGGGEVTLLELTSAYGVFANDGEKNQWRPVLQVEDSSGNILEKAENKPLRVLSSNTARTISDVLSDPRVRLPSLNSVINPLGKQVAVKTGTTNDYRDVWIVGYTPDIVIGAWAGKNDNTPMEKKVAGVIITPVWGAFLAEIDDKLSGERFKTQKEIDRDLKPVFRGIWKGGISYKQDTVSKKLATEYTPPETTEEFVFNSVHNILHWVDKSNPHAEIPENPKNDSQYESWEYGVRKWFEEWNKQNPDFKEVNNDEISIPKETDDVHLPENFPKIKIINPKNDDRFDDNDTISIKLDVQSKYKIKKIDLFVNNIFVKSQSSELTELSFVPKMVGVDKGEIVVKIIAYDEVWNRGENNIVLDIR